ncbi:hypothetical protein NSA50_01320 [Clostridium sp. DSM 100503]|uniref:hypothetical protein n=1 Tax=Clostridium sp. DSM 100503 TaxID=2963282 RepID=UPI00214A474C|nr:hypothetical protein [Clostridium sp. DSM 100503]MCR1949695.1 hypothetical protein [Clostridium sp. DSM 100503]
MSIIVLKYLLLGVVLLNLLVILGSRKFKKNIEIVNATLEYRREFSKLLKDLWKNQIIMIAIGVTLFLLAILIRENDNKIAINTFAVISNLYVLISAFLATYNYNNFNRGIVNLLNKIKG